MVHFICQSQSRFPEQDDTAYLDIREIGLNNAVHHTPDMGNGVLVSNLHTQLVPNEASCALSAEKVLCPHVFRCFAINMSYADRDRVLWVFAVVFKCGDGPRSLNLAAMLFNVFDKRPLDQALMQQRCERVPRIDELWTTCPSPGPENALCTRIPEGYFVDFGGIMGHYPPLEAHVSEQIQ